MIRKALGCIKVWAVRSVETVGYYSYYGYAARAMDASMRAQSAAREEDRYESWLYTHRPEDSDVSAS